MRTDKEKNVSVLVSSYNHEVNCLKECLSSIANQIGDFNIELVWVNDGGSQNHTALLKQELENLKKSNDFINVKYYENEENKGVSYSSRFGVINCSNDLIFRIDSDDIMFDNRIQKQFDYMQHNKNVMVCGSQMNLFKGKIENVVNITNHKSLTWDQYKKSPSHWIANHPTLCFRKSAVLEVGNYTTNKEYKYFEDFELQLRLLKKYNYLHNINEPLIYYRLHDTQITNEKKKGRNEKIDDLILKMTGLPGLIPVPGDQLLNVP